MIYGLNIWLPKLMNEAGFPLGSTLSFLLALNVGAALGSVIMGWIADLWGNKESNHYLLSHCSYYDHKLRFYDKYNSIICIGSSCRCYHHGNSKFDEFLYFPILSNFHSFYRLGLGFRNWTYHKCLDQQSVVFYSLPVLKLQ